MSSLSLAGRISRYYKLTPTRFFASAAARREKYGGGGVHKFRLARRRAEFFPAAAARHASGWRRGGEIRRLRGLPFAPDNYFCYFTVIRQVSALV